jgi:polysaccharide transporter, PST family
VRASGKLPPHMTDRPDQSTRGAEGDARRLLSVDHLQSDLVGRSVRSGTITLAAQGVKLLAQTAAIVVLARLLAPSDFGVFAMIAAFLVLLELFKDLGLSTATVQRAELTLRQVSTLFWLNTGLGLVIAAGFALAAPVLAWGYGEEKLLALAPVAAVAFVFTGLSAQHLALLRRQMRFADVARVQVGADVISLAVAVVAALAGWGVWSLVVQRVVWAFASAAGSWMACRWMPGRPGPLREVRAFLSYGANATAAMTVNYLAGSLDKILIGAAWGATALGFYDRAQRLQMLPIQNLNVPLGNVALAALSRVAGQPEAYRRLYLATIERLAMAIAPLGGVLIAGADPVVALVLGQQWSGTAPILAWMGVAMAYTPVSYAVSWLFMSQDRTGEMLRAGIVNGLLTIGAIAAGLPYGPVGVAASFVISGALLRVPVLFWFAGRRGPVGVAALWSVLVMPVGACALSAGAIALLPAWPRWAGLPTVLQVATMCAVAGLVAFAVYAAFPRGRDALRSLWRLPMLLASGRESVLPTTR